MTYTFVFNKITNRLISIIDEHGNRQYRDDTQYNMMQCGQIKSLLKVKVIN